MPELAPPLSADARWLQRWQLVSRLLTDRARLDSELRLQLAAWYHEDSPAGERRYLADELAGTAGISPRSAQRWIEDALVYAAFPAVQARLGQPLIDGGWLTQHADA